MRKWIKNGLSSKRQVQADMNEVGELAAQTAELSVSCKDSKVSTPQRRSGRKVRFQDQEALPPDTRYSIGRSGARFVRTLAETPSLKKLFSLRLGPDKFQKTLENVCVFLCSTIPVSKFFRNESDPLKGSLSSSWKRHIWCRMPCWELIRKLNYSIPIW